MTSTKVIGNKYFLTFPAIIIHAQNYVISHDDFDQIFYYRQ